MSSDRLQHFIGSMVLYEGEKADLFVVDGQQRLTTITIFLAALRDTFHKLGEAELAAGIQSVIQRRDISSKNRFVLLTESSYPYFQEYVQKFGDPDIDAKPSEEEEGIQAAYRFARVALSSLVEEVTATKKSLKSQNTAIKKRLEACRDSLLSLSIIIIQLDNEDDAYLVFETLNTRGKDLEPKDLIKNLLTKFLPAQSADVDTAKMNWNAIVNAISMSSAGINMSTYIHHWWLSQQEYTPEKTLFESFKRVVKKSNAREYLLNLRKDVETYRRIFEPNSFEWKSEEYDVRRSLAALNLFKVRQPAPFLLSVLRAYYEKRVSLKQLKESLSTIELFHFTYTAVAGQSSSGGVSKMYAAVARDLSRESDIQKRAKLLQDLKSKLQDRLPEKKLFAVGFSKLDYSQPDSRDKPLIKYILSKVDTFLRKDSVVNYDKMTIEHIAPQNPPDNVLQIVGYGGLGNLILVSEDLNGRLGNKTFVKKKEMYLSSNVPLDSVLKENITWDEAQIISRANTIIDIIFKK